MPDITNEEAYEKAFSKEVIDRAKWREEALRYALDNRKFEIDLYWKRAGYFWTLIAASFAGYFALRNVENAKRDERSIFVITCIGFILSFAWYLVNRGSKYWQENWERHVDVLSDKVVGPLYRTTLSRGEWWHVLKPFEGFPFSVSRVNQIVSLFITLLWVGLAIQAFLHNQTAGEKALSGYWRMAGFTVIFFGLLLWRGWPKRTKTPRRISFDLAEFGEEQFPDAPKEKGVSAGNPP